MSKSKIFFIVCLFFLVGTASASFFLFSYLHIFIGLMALIFYLILFALGTSKEKFIFVFCLLFFVFGSLRYSTFEDYAKKENDISNFSGHTITISGLVFEEIINTQKTQQIKIMARWAEEDGVKKETSGLILVVANPYPRYLYGDELQIRGKLQEPQNDENYSKKEQLAKEKIFSEVLFPKISLLSHGNGTSFWTGIYSMRKSIKEKLKKFLPEPHASFLEGLLVGAKSTLPKDFKDDLAASGTSHVVALSGYNITIIGLAVMNVLAFFYAAPWISFWTTMFFIILFTVFCGAEASLVRAAIMGILVLIAKKEGRAYNIKNALLFAATLMVFVNPKILRFDLSFQLSFLATIGIVYLSPVFSEKLTKVPRFLRLRETLAETLSAQIAVLPLLVLYFGRFSLISPVSNILILAVIPLTMFIGFVFLALSFLLGPLAQIMAYLVWIFLSYEIFIIRGAAALPFSVISSFWPVLLSVVFLYTMLIRILFYKKIKEIYEKIALKN